jgi:hypothetical protein
MSVGSDPVRERPPAIPEPRRVGLIVVGGLLVAGAAFNLVPMLLAVFLDTSVPISGRLLNLALFGLPTVLVLLAGVMLVRRGTGHALHVRVWPASTPGRWAVGMVAGSVAAVGASMLVLVMGRGGEAVEGFFDHAWAAVPLLAGWAAAFTGLVAGTIAMVTRQDRSALLLAAVGIGLFVTLFGLAEALLAG